MVRTAVYIAAEVHHYGIGSETQECSAGHRAGYSFHRPQNLQGSRHKDDTALAGGMPKYKWLSGKILTWMENRTFGLRMTDYHSGFLVYSRRAASTIPFDQLSTYFDFDLEVIASARARGLMVDELGIPTRYADEDSHLNPIWYGLRCLRVMIRYRMGRYRPRLNP